MRDMYYVDMHCHPAMKPFSWIKTGKLKINGYSRNEKTSLWYNDPPTRRDKTLNKAFGLTKFTQSDFRTLRKGDVKIISACLNPIERNLFLFRRFGRILPPRLLKYVIGVSLKFIRMVRKKGRNYFEELEEEYKYYEEEWKRQDEIFPTRFELTSDFREIETHLKNTNEDIISVFFSIEGCHVFNNGGLDCSLKDKEDIEKNIQTIKNWSHPPLYVSVAHMMYNELCGHAKSLPSLLAKFMGQMKGANLGFTECGEVLLHKLLEHHPRRIYIDIKHMNLRSRKEYYGFLDSEQYEDKCIPVLASHGAVIGRSFAEEKKQKKLHVEIKSKFQNENDLKFYDAEINFFDEEILRIEDSRGFLGIQLDERRLCKEKKKYRKKWKSERGERLRYQAGLVWKQIRYIAEVLNDDGKFGWGTAAIGSDYDGLVDPPDGYWTADDFGILEENLIQFADEYFKNQPKLNSANMCSPRYVIDLFMRGNALRFLNTFLHDPQYEA